MLHLVLSAEGTPGAQPSVQENMDDVNVNDALGLVPPFWTSLLGSRGRVLLWEPGSGYSAPGIIVGTEADLQEGEVTIWEGIIGHSGDKLIDVHYKSGMLILPILDKG